MELTQVETSVEAEVIISMLSAYAIYAYTPGMKGRNEPFFILVVDADLEDAKALLNAANEDAGD